MPKHTPDPGTFLPPGVIEDPAPPPTADESDLGGGFYMRLKAPGDEAPEAIEADPWPALTARQQRIEAAATPLGEPDEIFGEDEAFIRFDHPAFAYTPEEAEEYRQREAARQREIEKDKKRDAKAARNRPKVAADAKDMAIALMAIHPTLRRNAEGEWETTDHGIAEPFSLVLALMFGGLPFGVEVADVDAALTALMAEARI